MWQLVAFLLVIESHACKIAFAITEDFTSCNNKLLHYNKLAKLHIYDRRCDSSTKDWVNKVWVQLTHHLKVRVTDGNLLTRLGARDVIASKNVFETLSIESQLRVFDKAGFAKVLKRYDLIKLFRNKGWKRTPKS